MMTELEIALDRLDRIRALLKSGGEDMDEALHMHMMDVLEDNGPIDFPYYRERMTPEQIEHEREADE